MSETLYRQGDWEELLRWTLRESVRDVEPSSAGWRRIRMRCAAGDDAPGPASAWASLRITPALQALAAGVLVVGLGLSFGVRPITWPIGGDPHPTETPGMAMVNGASCDDMLSGRAAWLAGREAAPSGSSDARASAASRRTPPEDPAWASPGVHLNAGGHNRPWLADLIGPQ